MDKTERHRKAYIQGFPMFFIMNKDRLDIHHSGNLLDYYITRIDEEKDISAHQKERFKRFIDEAQMGKNSKKKVGDRRLIANLQSFFRLQSYFKKDFDKLTEKELETFYKDLDHDRIRQLNGNTYKSSSKDELIRNLKRYLKWIWDEDHYKKNASWMREAELVPEIPAITLEQGKKLSKAMKFRRDETLTFFLFDSGLRIEEALNLKISDVELKKKTDNDEYYIINVQGTKTKLAKRKIGVPIVTPLLTDWLKNHPAILDKSAYVFGCSYAAYVKVLRATSKAVLGFSVTPHQLRHSSATHYAQKKNMSYPLFCYRYGWDLNSDVPKRYIDTSKFDEAQEELDNIIKSDRVNEIKNQNNILEKEVAELKTFKDEMTKLIKESGLKKFKIERHDENEDLIEAFNKN